MMKKHLLCFNLTYVNYKSRLSNTYYLDMRNLFFSISPKLKVTTKKLFDQLQFVPNKACIINCCVLLKVLPSFLSSHLGLVVVSHVL